MRLRTVFDRDNFVLQDLVHLTEPNSAQPNLLYDFPQLARKVTHVNWGLRHCNKKVGPA